MRYTFYYTVFMTYFNIGFGNHTDVGSLFIKKRASIRNTVNVEQKRYVLTELLVHQMRAKKFYSLMNDEVDDSVLIKRVF